jgi:hypothetical protein
MDIISVFTEWLSKTGLILIVIGALIGFVLKVRTFIKRLKMGNKEIWKEKMISKLSKALEPGEFIDIILIIRDLLRVIPSEDLVGLIIEYRNKFDIQQDMKDSITDLKSLLSFEKKIISNPIDEILREYRQRKSIAEIKNKKRWKKLKKDKTFKEAVGVIANHYNKIKKLAIDEGRKKGRIKEIEIKIRAIKSEENIIRNRERRFAIEKINEKREIMDKEKELNVIKERLFDVFKNSD